MTNEGGRRCFWKRVTLLFTDPIAFMRDKIRIAAWQAWVDSPIRSGLYLYYVAMSSRQKPVDALAYGLWKNTGILGYHLLKYKGTQDVIRVWMWIGVYLSYIDYAFVWKSLFFWRHVSLYYTIVKTKGMLGMCVCLGCWWWGMNGIALCDVVLVARVYL